VKIGVSLLEIYQEQLNDLLCPSTSAGNGGPNGEGRLQIRQDASGETGSPEVRGLKVAFPETCAEALSLYHGGMRLRRLGVSEKNSRSSRSHTVFSLHIRRLDTQTGETLGVGKFNLIDLAGSERQSSSSAFDRTRVTEASSINQSLTTLGKVVQACVLRSAARERDRERVHVPYRDSMLTRLLSDSIGGQAKSLIIGHVTPHEEDAQESCRTLQFATGAARVQERCSVSGLETTRMEMDTSLLREESRFSPMAGSSKDALPAQSSGKNVRASAKASAVSVNTASHRHGGC
jgi:hypothetical protein